uniref:Uncharacterized protein n=1 Tax=Triticum urartu TaxID=4572 RepID=A0A8R7V7R7_TRIUA
MVQYVRKIQFTFVGFFTSSYQKQKNQMCFIGFAIYVYPFVGFFSSNFASKNRFVAVQHKK